MRAAVVFLEMILLLALAAGLGIGSQFVRSDSLPLLKDWSEVRQEQNTERGITSVTAQEAFELWQNDAAYFVDARSSMSFIGGHVPGAVNCYPKADDQSAQPLSDVLPMLDEQQEEEACGPGEAGGFNAPDLPRDKPVVVYCDSLSCGLSDIVAEAMHKAGYQVKVMPDGIEGWMNVGGDLQGGPQ